MSLSSLARKTFAIAGAASAVAAAVAAVAASAGAASAPPMTVAVHPASGPLLSYFDFSARPGQSTPAGTLELRNRTRHKIVVWLDPVDSVTATTLGSAYKVRGLPIHGQTRWTRLPVRRVILRAHASRRIRVTIQPPHNARPGDYLSGIGIQAKAGAKQQRLRGNVAVASVERYAIGVLARIPGPRHPQVSFTGARVGRDPSGLIFTLLARNTGNVVLENVTGSVQVTRGKRVVANARIGPGTFVSGTRIAYPVPVPREQPAEGTVYRVRAVIRYPGGAAHLDTPVRFGHTAAMRQQSFGGPKASHGGGFPAWLGGLIGAVLALAAGTAYFLRRRALGIPAAESVLERAVAGAYERGEPLSVIRLATADADSTRAIPAVARTRTRHGDAICRLTDSSIVVIAPDTSPATANALAAELRRDFDRGANLPPVAIDVFALNGDRTAAELLARMGGASDGGAFAPA